MYYDKYFESSMFPSTTKYLFLILISWVQTIVKYIQIYSSKLHIQKPKRKNILSIAITKYNILRMKSLRTYVKTIINCNILIIT